MSVRPPKYDWPTVWPDPKKLTKNWLGLILTVCAILFLFPAFWVAISFFVALATLNYDLIGKLWPMYVVVLGAPFVLWRLLVGQWNLENARDDLKRSQDRDYADLFTKAIEQLGAVKNVKEVVRTTGGAAIHHGAERVSEERTEPNIEVRLGAIYALQRISQASERDHIAVMEVLCAYIRQNSLATNSDLGTPPDEEASPLPDIQAAVTVLGRRDKDRKEFEKDQQFRLDLHGANFRGVDFTDTDFSATLFHRSSFDRAIFKDCNLVASQFDHSTFSHVEFLNPILKGSSFDFCEMENTVTFYFDDESEKDFCVSVVGARLGGTNLSRIEFPSVFGSFDTELSSQYDDEKKEQCGLEHRLQVHEGLGNVAEAEKIRLKLEGSIFGHWSDRSFLDGLTVSLKRKFFKKHGLIGWPYQ